MAEKFNAFYRSDIWHIMKSQFNITVDTVNKRALSELLTGKTDKAIEYASKGRGILEAIELTERLSGQFSKGILDADIILGVIENKPSKGETWQAKIWKMLRMKR